MLKKTAGQKKFRKPSPSLPSMVVPVALSIVVLGLSACSGRDSGTGTPTGSNGSGSKGGTFQAPPIESGQEVPEGLDDKTGQALIAVLQAEPDYSAYVSLLQLSDVSRVLATRDSLTVFAPVNEAVRAQASLLDRYLKPGDLESVLEDLESGKIPEISNPERLGRLLSRGIADGEAIPSVLRAGLKLKALEGEPLRITRSGGDFRVDGVRFDSKSGTLATNGVLYPAAGLVRP